MKTFNFGQNLRKIRQSKDISQEAMALKLNISQPTYSRIEGESKIPANAMVVRIAKVLDVDPSELMPPSTLKVILGGKLKEVLNTRIGILIVFGSGLMLVISAHDLAQSFCIEFKTSDATRYIVKWTAAISTTAYIVYCVRKIMK
ncbi:MAG: helix-turn-helix transcriptional regulator [Pedobacter sp.]|nr:helix-turn-helix transcriptional regulator [Pedobacter sp.]